MCPPQQAASKYVSLRSPSSQSYPQPGAAQAEGVQEQPGESRLFAVANQKCSVFFTRGLDGNKDYSQFHQDAPELRDFLVFLQGLYNEIKTDKKSKAEAEILLAGLDAGRIKAILNNVKKSPSLKELVDKIGDPELRTKIEQALKDDPILQDLKGILQKMRTLNPDFVVLTSIVFFVGSFITLLGLLSFAVGPAYLLFVMTGLGLAVMLSSLFTAVASIYSIPKNLHYSLEEHWKSLLVKLHKNTDVAQAISINFDLKNQLEPIVSLGNELFGMRGEITPTEGRSWVFENSPERENLQAFIPQVKFLIILQEIFPEVCQLMKRLDPHRQLIQQQNREGEPDEPGSVSPNFC